MRKRAEGNRKKQEALDRQERFNDGGNQEIVDKCNEQLKKVRLSLFKQRKK